MNIVKYYYNLKQLFSKAEFSSLLQLSVSHTLRKKRYKSCHWGRTFSKVPKGCILVP